MNTSCYIIGDYLITGAEGFIGSRLCKYIVARREIIQCDIRDKKAVDALPDVKRVYHLAAVSSVEEVKKDYEYAYSVNVCGTQHLASRYGSRLTYVSTTSIDNAYAATKRIPEAYVRKKKGKVVRLPNVYGPGGHGIIDRWIKLYNDREPLEVFGTGTQTVDLIHVIDACAAIFKGWASVTSGLYFTIQDLLNFFPYAYVKYLPRKKEHYHFHSKKHRVPFRLAGYIRENINVRTVRSV